MHGLPLDLTAKQRYSFHTHQYQDVKFKHFLLLFVDRRGPSLRSEIIGYHTYEFLQRTTTAVATEKTNMV